MTEYIYNNDGIKVRESIQPDIDFLKTRLKQEDIDEVWDSNHLSSEEALQLSFNKSLQSYTIENSHPIAMYGISSENLIDGKGIIWLLSSNELEKIKVRFLIHCREYINNFLNIIPYLENWISCNNKKAIEWLKFCGAQFDKPEQYGLEGKTFRHFYFEKERSKEIIANHIPKNLSMRKKIEIFSKMMNKIPGVVHGNHPMSPLTHQFGGGMYVRELFIPKGMFGIGKIHKHEHPSFLMKGEVSVITESTGLERLKAPMSFISPAGTQRVVYAHEDTIWVTVHQNPNEYRDIDLIEDEVIAKSFDEIEDYQNKYDLIEGEGI